MATTVKVYTNIEHRKCETYERVKSWSIDEQGMLEIRYDLTNPTSYSEYFNIVVYPKESFNTVQILNSDVKYPK